MSYFNTISQVVSGVSAGSAFTHVFIVQNQDMGGIQVIWSNLNQQATFKLQSNIEETGTYWGDILYTTSSGTQTATVTAVSLSDNQPFRVTSEGGRAIKFVWSPTSNTAGTLDVWVARKARR